MTTLADLIALAAKAETFGLKPEEVNVEFKAGSQVISLLDAKACVTVTDAKAKPTLTINFTTAKSGWDYQGR